jgi:hypothetical protein
MFTSKAKSRRFIIIGLTFVIVALFLSPYPKKIVRRLRWMATNVMRPPAERVPPPVVYTAEDHSAHYGPAVRPILAAMFARKHLSYPPEKIAMVMIKDQNRLLLYARENGRYKFVCSYKVLAASGVLGPKLREGDRQVPEGIYNLTLEPNTPYHLALRLNYPNATDWRHAAEDGRPQPGSDILVHGNQCSIGCIAMGDPVSEELFIAAYDARDKDLPLIIAPVDLRKFKAPEASETDPPWLPQHYEEIKDALRAYPLPQ